MIRHLHPRPHHLSHEFLRASRLALPPMVDQTTTDHNHGKNPSRTHLLTPDESLMCPPSPSIQHAVDGRVLFSVRGREVTLSSLILGRGEGGVAVQRWGGDYRRHILCMRAFVCLSIVCEGLGKGDEEGDQGRGRDMMKLIDHSIAWMLRQQVYLESEVRSSGFLAFLPNIFVQLT